jgi:hypothetical protein
MRVRPNSPFARHGVDLRIREGKPRVAAAPRGSVKLYAREGGRTLLPALELADAVSEKFFSFDSLAPGEYALLWQRPGARPLRS